MIILIYIFFTAQVRCFEKRKDTKDGVFKKVRRYRYQKNHLGIDVCIRALNDIKQPLFNRNGNGCVQGPRAGSGGN
jgi:hypothetical protein